MNQPRYAAHRPNMDYGLKQFLFMLTFPENKEKVYREIRNDLSVKERLLLIQMTRRRGEWYKVSGPELNYRNQPKTQKSC